MLFAQYQVTIDATVFDKNTNRSIPFVNIEFVESNIKTISNKDGQFKLVYDENSINRKSLFCISALGYRTIKVESSQLFKLLKNTNKIYLVPNSYTARKTTKQSIRKKHAITTGNIYGDITSDAKPIQSATIRIKNSFIETQTDVDGKYRINATEDDVLVVSYLGMLTKEILISNKSNINIELEPDGEVLNEVFLEGKSKKEDLIDLGISGKKSFDAIGYATNVITAKDIGQQYNSLEDLLNGKFAIRKSNGSMNAALGMIRDIDGMIFSGEDGIPMPDINPQNIESITIIKSLAGTVKYGTQGRGGVMVIRTKTNGFNKAEAKAKSALATGNNYEENYTQINTSLKTPIYIKELKKSNSYEEALSIYKTQKMQASQLSIPYFIEVSNYFKKWDNNYAHTILSSIGNIAYDNPKALKTLAYTLESQGKLEEAKYVYQRIANLRPKAAQSYRDLALIYAKTGYYKEAMELYGQMLNNKIEGVIFLGLEGVITNELKHLLALHRGKIDYSNVHADYLKAGFKYDMRIVFEWNDANTEFEVQFVNPKKKFFKWSQTKFDNRDKMLDGITKGYHAEEFIIDDDERGEWIINIESLNEEPPLNPTYLKYTVYRNYGLANETKVIKVINLNDCNEKVTLDKLINR